LQWATNVADEGEKNLTDAPKWQGSLYAVIRPIENLSVIPQLDFSSKFYNNSDPNPTSQLAGGNPPRTTPISPVSPGYVLANLKVSYELNEHLTFDVGVKNMFDQTYYYSWYYPEAGRSYYAGITTRY
jgi:iron complex outermembrane receptor protein